MKKLLLVLLTCVVLCFGGCAGLMDTAPERDRRLSLSYDLQMRQIVDDADYIMMWDHNAQTTEYHVFLGY